MHQTSDVECMKVDIFKLSQLAAISSLVNLIKIKFQLLTSLEKSFEAQPKYRGLIPEVWIVTRHLMSM